MKENNWYNYWLSAFTDWRSFDRVWKDIEFVLMRLCYEKIEF